MKFTLQELLEQKALHEKHLELINARIAELQARGGQPQPEPEAAPSPAPAAPTENTAPPPPPVAPAAPVAPPAEPEEEDAKKDVVLETPMGNYALDRSMTAADAKKGCVVWTVGFVVISALILIAVYFLYPDKNEQDSSPPPEKGEYVSPYAN